MNRLSLFPYTFFVPGSSPYDQVTQIRCRQSTRSAAKSSLDDVVRDTAEKLALITSKLEKLDRMEQHMEEIRTENRQLRAVRFMTSTTASMNWSSIHEGAASEC